MSYAMSRDGSNNRASNGDKSVSLWNTKNNMTCSSGSPKSLMQTQNSDDGIRVLWNSDHDYVGSSRALKESHKSTKTCSQPSDNDDDGIRVLWSSENNRSSKDNRFESKRTKSSTNPFSPQPKTMKKE